ncbi:MAG: polysaccharide deacetylase family protein [Planctomycetes bacterium]|nr:polysaccharide deacetylase family protein [Planctomycetota bacterium]
MLPTRRCGFAAALLAAACAGAPARWTFDHGAPVRGDRGAKALAFVFTGSEFGEGTAVILDALAARGLPASFFVTGAFLAQSELRAAVPRMLAAGHYVGPHSHGHLLYCAWDDRRRSLVDEPTFRADLQQNLAELRALGALPPGQPVWFIPPYEWFNEAHVAWAAAIGVRLCNFTPGSGSNRDYVPEGERGFVPSARIRGDVLAYEAREPDGLDGFLLLLHLGSARADKMHGELGALLDALRARGYRFVRVDELLGD